MTRYEYPIINVEAENEHFNISESVISWMECCRSSLDTNPKESLAGVLPAPAAFHRTSAPAMGWNIVKIFSENQGLPNEISELANQSNVERLLAKSDELLLSGKLSQAQLAVDTNDKNAPVQDQPTSHLPFESADLKLPNHTSVEPVANSDEMIDHHQANNQGETITGVRMRGTDEWAPPRAQIIFNIHEETNFRRLLVRQNYRCAGCGNKIDPDLARRLVLYCHYLGKYFCKCCFSHKAIHLPGYILQRWDFHKYPVSHFALQLLDRIANEPLFNINDINPSLYRKVKKLKHLIDLRMQLYYLKIYITTCQQTDKLNNEYATFTQQHLLQDDVHLYSLNNLIEVQHGKLYEYLNDLVTRSIAHIAQCDRCRAKGHYCQLCGPSSLMSSMILNSNQQPTSPTASNSDQQQSSKLKHSESVGQNIYQQAANAGSQMHHPQHQQQHQQQQQQQQQRLAQQKGQHSRSSSGNYANFSIPQLVGQQPIRDHELIFPFEIGRVAQCPACGCCFHLQCFKDAGHNCPKCERIQRRRVEEPTTSTNSSANKAQSASNGVGASPPQSNSELRAS